MNYKNSATTVIKIKNIILRVTVYSLTFISAVFLELLFLIIKSKLKNKIAVNIVNFFGEVFVMKEYYDPYFKRKVNAVVMATPSLGCSYYFKTGGCTMCGFCNEIKKYQFHNFHPIAIGTLVKIFLVALGQKIESSEKKIEVFTVYMAGSFLNENDLPFSAQDLIINFFLSLKNCKKIVIECRADYIIANEERIKKYVPSIGDSNKVIEFAIGLESADVHIRNSIIKKGMSNKQYFEAINIVKKYGAISNSYVLVGSPFLNQKDIVQKTIETCLFAWDNNSDIVSLEIYCVQNYTLWANYYADGDLKLLSLWDILEILKAVNEYSEDWYLGEFADWPVPIETPKNCSNCTDAVLKVLMKLRKTHDLLLALKEVPVCHCKD